MKCPFNKGISPAIASVLMIAIAVVASLITYAWVTGYMGLTTEKSDWTATILPAIYNPDKNIGVLNEKAFFEISIKNRLNSTLTITTIILTEKGTIYNKTFSVDSNSQRNITISQDLIYTGLWTVMVTDGHGRYNARSFITLTNTIDAEIGNLVR